MKHLLYILVFSTTLISWAQELPHKQALQEKDEDYFMHLDADAEGNPIGPKEFLPGCSWYCGGNVKSIRVSSHLSGSTGFDYKGENAHDFDKNTAWVEAQSDYGIGESITYTFDFSEIPNYEGQLGINKLIIANGYKKTKSTWEKNARIKQLKMYVNDKAIALIDLVDSFEIQTVAIDQISFPVGKQVDVRFEITAVYPGTLYKDTALSLLVFDGVGVH